MPFVKIGENAHHYATQGNNARPALVFANSLGTDFRIWSDVAAGLADEYYVILYDKRGHGLTDASAPPYSAADLAGDVIGLLDYLSVRQAIVCGVSVGGIIAQAMALHHPERVSALVLSDTGARIGSVESWQQRIDLVESGGVAPLEEITMERWFSKGFRERQPAAIRGYSNMLLQTRPEGYIGTCGALRDADFRADLGRVERPALVICGAEDIATPPEMGRELAGLIPGAQFSLIENAAHLPCVEQPAAVAQRMKEFFREVQRG